MKQVRAFPFCSERLYNAAMLRQTLAYRPAFKGSYASAQHGYKRGRFNLAWVLTAA